MGTQKVKLFNSLEEGIKTIPSGEKRLVRIGNNKICLVNQGSKFIAFQNECPHMKHPLDEGVLNPFGEIVCAMHSYRFSLKSGEESNNRCHSLQFHRVVNESEGISIEL